MGKAYYDNGYYEGSFKDGTQIRHGFGTYYWKNGDKYVGDYKNDERTGYGTYTWANGDKYVGDFKCDKRTGYGTYYWKEGDKYVGDFKCDERTGNGTYYYPNGDKYVGEFLNGKKHGKGTFYRLSGIREEAEFRDDWFHGKTTVYFKNRLISEEEYDTGVLHGKRINYPLTNVREECTFVNGKKQGACKWYNYKGEITFEGTYKDGLMHGICYRYDYFKGERYEEKWQDDKFIKTVSVQPLKTSFNPKNFVTVNYPDGRKYVGEVNGNKPHGMGTMHLATHSDSRPNYYIGYFARGRYSGHGKLVETYMKSDDTSIYEGEFKNGFRHGLGYQQYKNGKSSAGGAFRLNDLKGVCVLTNYILGISLIVGTIRNDSLRGCVHFRYDNGDQYNGKCKDYQKHGKGCYTYANGDYVMGKFKKEKLDGKATYYEKATDSYFSCVYKNGKQISKTKRS